MPKKKLDKEDLLAVHEARLAKLKQQLNKDGVGDAPEVDFERILRERGIHEPWRRFDARAQVTFLKTFALTGRIAESARAAGVSKQTVHDHRKKDEIFAELYEEALDSYRDRIESEVHRRALVGLDKPVYQKGELVGYVREYSDRMLELLAKRHIVEYSDKLEIKQAQPGGVMVIPAASISDQEWEEQEGENCRHDKFTDEELNANG